MEQYSKEKAIEMYKARWWEGKTAKEIVDVQLYQDKLCIEFAVFHKAMEEVLGRPVFTHEFADQKALQEEYEGKRQYDGIDASIKRIVPEHVKIIREAYTNCMKPYMIGGGPERKERFCQGAKLCSGKAKTESEAKALCAEAAKNPKPPKAPKGRKVCTLRDLEAISVCVTQNINLSNLTPENMQEAFSNALKRCSGATSAKVKSAKATLSSLDPKHIAALEAIGRLSKEAEGRKW